MFRSIPIGAQYMILSALAFSIMSLFVKAAGQQGVPVIEIVAARALVSLLISFVALKRKRIPLLGNNKPLLLARGLIGFFALLGVFYGITHLPLAEATVIQYLHPMFTALLAALLLKERPSSAILICILLSFCGLLLIVRPGFLFLDQSAPFEPIAIAAAIGGAFGSACAYILVRKLSPTEDPLVIVMYFPLVSIVGCVPLLWGRFVMPEGITWLYLLGVGLATQIGQVALTKGMQTETATQATSFSYLQVVFAVLLGMVFYSEIPSIWTLLGICCIIGGAYINLKSR